MKFEVQQSDKSKLEMKKKHLQQQFRQKMGLLVVVPKPYFGSTNGRNTAQNFFDLYEDSGRASIKILFIDLQHF